MSSTSAQASRESTDIVIVGGGSAGIATAASMLKRPTFRKGSIPTSEAIAGSAGLSSF
jgi:glycine/D-amino acid oxidase-like deaminating enzyme